MLEAAELVVSEDSDRVISGGTNRVKEYHSEYIAGVENRSTTLVRVWLLAGQITAAWFDNKSHLLCAAVSRR